MAKFMVVNPKTFVDNKLVPVGTVLTLESIPASLVGKVQEVPEAEKKKLEVATPKAK